MAVRLSRSTLVFAVGLAAFAFTSAFLVQEVGCNQTSHYSLVRALANGTTRIDAWQGETCDKSFTNGHFYSNKAPGLAFVTLPYYAVLHAAGLVSGDIRTAVWEMGIWGAVLVSVIVLVLVRYGAERLEPGTGTCIALLLGLATLLFPFSTMFFAHALSALVLLGAFLLAWRGRESGSLRSTVLAGVLAGFAPVIEYPLALVSLLLGAYCLSGPLRLRAGGAYVLGAVCGIWPLLVYQAVAFGSAFHVAYTNQVINSGQSGHDVIVEHEPSGTFFGIGLPGVTGVADVLASSRGLLLVTPIMALVPAGALVLWRRGLRAEAAFLGAAVTVAVLWNGAFRPPFPGVLGGDVPGPRYLVPVLPFAALALAPILRLAPRTFGVLAGVSVATMVVATLTDPLLGNGYTRAWLDFARDGEFTHTLLTYAGAGHGWLAVLPAVLGVAAMIGTVSSEIPWRSGRDSWLVAGVALLAWGLAATYVPARGGAMMGDAGTRVAVVLSLLALAIAAAWLLRAEAKPAPRRAETRSAGR